MMPGRLYAGRIAHLDLTPQEYRSLIDSPSSTNGPVGGGAAAVVVRGNVTDLAMPGSSCSVVLWVGSEFGGDGPSEADVVVSEADVDELLGRIEAAPLAARSLAVLLRSLGGVTVDVGLAMESAVYSTLQAGPEFAEWRADTPPVPDADERPTVLIERDDDVVVITLDRAHRHNASPPACATNSSVHWRFHSATHRYDRCCSRHGPSFCSGGDLGEFGSRPDPATAHITRLARSPARLIDALRDRITVDLHGATMGGGIEMAAFVQRVRARPDTRIALPEIGLGLIPGAGGTVSLSRRAGRQRTAVLALSGRTVDATTALRWGLVDELIDDQ